MTVHNEANIGDIYETVIMPGDPYRAKYIAENFLEDVKLVNSIRCNYCYSGTYKGKKVSVMSSGMGMPSMGIYSYELYKFYNVNNIIRIGTCGSFTKETKINDMILVNGSYTHGNFAKEMNDKDVHFVESSKELNLKIEDCANKNGINIKKENMLCTEYFDVYLDDFNRFLEKIPKEYNLKGSEMEAFALFYTAKTLNKNASCLLTVVDSHFEDKIVSAEDRQNSLNDMIKLALESV